MAGVPTPRPAAPRDAPARPLQFCQNCKAPLQFWPQIVAISDAFFITGLWHPTRQRPKWLCGGVGSLPMRRINEARALGQIDVEREMAEVREERAEYRRKAEEERRKQQEANLALREAQVGHRPGSRKCKIPREPLAPRRRASCKPPRALGPSGPPAP